MTKPLFIASADTRLLAAELKKLKVGEVASYAALSAAISKPVAGDSGPLRSARHAIESETGARFGCIQNVGIKRLSDVEIVDQGVHDTIRIRKMSKRGVKRLAGVQDFAAMPNDKQLQHSIRMSILSAVSSVSSEKAAEKIAAAASGRMSELPVSETLSLFSAKAG